MSDSASLSISSVQKSNEGTYRCIISNWAGNQTSKPAKLSTGMTPDINLVFMKYYNCIPALHTADPPRITTHPKELKDVVAGKPAILIVEATGTDPLSYQWQQKPRGGKEGWQCCDVEGFPGADSSRMTIPSAQKSNEGSYHCTVSNCANSVTSNSATLTLGELKCYVCTWGYVHVVVADKAVVPAIYTSW